jgi:hypothetical protein
MTRPRPDWPRLLVALTVALLLAFALLASDNPPPLILIPGLALVGGIAAYAAYTPRA